MEPKVVQLSKTEHKNIKLSPNTNFEHLASHHLAPVIIQETPRLSAELPMAFIKNNQTNEYVFVALLGMKEGENLMVKDGKWQGNMIPASYTHFPISLIPSAEDKSKYGLTIDMSSEAVSETVGEPIFQEDGEETEAFKKRRQTLENFYQCSLSTHEFVKTMADLDLLLEQTLSFDVQGEQRNIAGINIIDEQKLNALSDEDFLSLRKKGYLTPIYAHFNSLGQTINLVNKFKG